MGFFSIRNWIHTHIHTHTHKHTHIHGRKHTHGTHTCSQLHVTINFITDCWYCWCIHPQQSWKVQKFLPDILFIRVCWTITSGNCSWIWLDSNGYYHSEREPVYLGLLAPMPCPHRLSYISFLSPVNLHELGYREFGCYIQVWGANPWHYCYNWSQYWCFSLRLSVWLGETFRYYI